MEILYKEREQKFQIFELLNAGSLFKSDDIVYMKVKDKHSDYVVDLKNGILINNPKFDSVALLNAELSVEDTYK